MNIIWRLISLLNFQESYIQTQQFRTVFSRITMAIKHWLGFGESLALGDAL